MRWRTGLTLFLTVIMLVTSSSPRVIAQTPLPQQKAQSTADTPQTQIPLAANGLAESPPDPNATPEPPLPPEPTARIPAPTSTPDTPPQPGLRLSVSVPGDVLLVGTTIAVTLTLENDSRVDASNVHIALPLPDGVSASGQASRGARTLDWTLPKLSAGTQWSTVAQLDIASLPTTGALFLSASATATNASTSAQAQRGAVVLDVSGSTKAASSPSEPTRFTPGRTTVLTGSDTSISVEIPATASDRSLRLYQLRSHDLKPTSAISPELRAAVQTIPRRSVAWRHSFGVFYLEALDDAGNDIHTFKEPLTIRIRYTPEQVQALELDESTLTLFWFDDRDSGRRADGTQQAGHWVPIPTTVDFQSHTISAKVDHFSAFTLSDGTSPSSAFVPSLQGFQVSQFTGAATYSIPINVPAGPNGMKPSLSLSYSSAATDGKGGERDKWQASWVGKGWNLEVGSVVRNASVIEGTSPDDDFWDSFGLTFDGQSFTAIRADASTNGVYRAVDETFARIQKISETEWRAWTKDGLRYEFAQPLYWRDARYDSGDNRKVYRWLLTRVVDTNGNKVDYFYHVDTIHFPTGQPSEPAYDPTWYLQRIEWGHAGTTPGTGSATYQVVFDVDTRSDTDGVDDQWECHANPGNQNYFCSISPHEKYTLTDIRVESRGTGSTFQLIRKYHLGYADSNSVIWTDDLTRQGVATLSSVQMLDNTGGGSIPSTSFTYGRTPGTGDTRPADFNRLITIDNGRGGKVEFTYELNFNKSNLPGEDWTLFRNYHRVKEVRRIENSGNAYAANSSYLTTYSYTNPEVNRLEYAATVAYAKNPPGGYDNSLAYLASAEKHEFRGHRIVEEKVYKGLTVSDNDRLQWTKTYFYQGDYLVSGVPCTPPVSDNSGTANDDVDTSSTCYQEMVKHESWKGKEYKIERLSNTGGSILERTEHEWERIDLPDFADCTNNCDSGYERVGLWRAFNYIAQTTETKAANLSPAVVKTTEYTYDADHFLNNENASGAEFASGTHYGNLTHTTECTDNGATCRITRRHYVIRDDTSNYITDRVWEEETVDSQGNFLAMRQTFYDGNQTSPGRLGTKGQKTREAVYYDLYDPTTGQPRGNLSNVTLHGPDHVWEYDNWGNVTNERTYPTAGTRLWNGSAWSISSPGSGSTPRTTTTVYQYAYLGIPTQVTNPVGHVEQATWDYRMGTLQTVTDANSQVTSAEYDMYGRMTKLIRPGDSSSVPTTFITYADTEEPFRIRIDKRETSDPNAFRPTTEFYDGLGRKIQTKAESVNGSQTIVTDYQYDALDRVVKQSLPHYVSETSGTFWTWRDPAGQSGMEWSETVYDRLGRIYTSIAADGTTTEYRYGTVNELSRPVEVTDVMDGNRHRVLQRTDGFGRLVSVHELSGDCGSYGGTSYSCTTPPNGVTWAAWSGTYYSYDKLDRLIQVQDGNSKLTTVAWDSGGRKTSLTDPTLGTWSYTYDANGNLDTHTDARGIVVDYDYDALDRVTEVDGAGNSGQNIRARRVTYTYDAGTGTHYNRGHLTDARVYGDGFEQYRVHWDYDGRGRNSFTNHIFPGLNNLSRPISHRYDRADRVTELIYPNGFRWYPSYDAGWRESSGRLCDHGCTTPPTGGLTVTSATWTAENLPSTRVLSNSLRHAWTYDADSRRLDTLKVGTTGDAGSLMNRQYSYDAVGNITSLTDYLPNPDEVQTFAYDHRNRLTSWTVGSTTESYAYDKIGNFTTKGSASYTYPTSGKVYSPSSIGGNPYTYDSNGNTLTGAGRTFKWDSTNQPWRIEKGSVAEEYAYNQDGSRVVRLDTTSMVHILTLDGVWEEEVDWVSNAPVVLKERAELPFGGDVVAVAERSPQVNQTTTLTFLHSDHLNSASLETNSSGLQLNSQKYDPWGKVRSGTGNLDTRRGFTGYRDDTETGLLYAQARYYDAGIGRFISADSIVPNAGPLTVHPGDTVENVAWQDSTTASSNPQDLGRYTYVHNNPIRETDPSGHCELICIFVVGAVVIVVAGTYYNAYQATNSEAATNLERAFNDKIREMQINQQIRNAEEMQRQLAEVAKQIDESACKPEERVREVGSVQPNPPAPTPPPGSGIDPSTLTLDDVISNPSLLNGLGPEDVPQLVAEAQSRGWRVETLGRGSRAGQGLILREVNSNGQLTGRITSYPTVCLLIGVNCITNGRAFFRHR